MGTVYFDKDVTLRALETVDFIGSGIVDYSYEVRQASDKLYWYDCWPHPDNPRLASTHPHHKHISPNIKHRRVPAPELSFDKPNLTFVIEEIERILAAL